ncbi:MAG TPA: PDR/VanB family oxidoreductase [Rhodocyclaceae bacterium]|uniref:PDR/VanB family oxidoreductase n=1 Tax=Thauera sp. TaxID=1905334 RepID=UPI002C15F1FD|nr:PDR/VanB family oxidoreductase [Thauera sp.]HRP26621.1 PDR/VanB family oxidoreductase [Thauera sp.]HRQ48493.1 PDR/VanB family oxidoreductase [Rhodocyclaceae bacterium]
MSGSEEHTLLAVRVRRRTQLADDIIGLELGALDGAPLPAWAAGAHIDVELPNGLLRQYSLCGDSAHTGRYEIGILRDPASRGGSASAHDDIHEGGEVRIGAPRNLFGLRSAQRSLLFAGGIGITPILAMAQELTRSGADFRLHYASRTPSRTAFIDRINASAFADRVQFHFDDGAAAQRFDAVAAIGAPDPATHLYVCGPRGYMDHVIATARSLGWRDDNIHFEYFAAALAEGEVAGDGHFEIRLAGRDLVVPVPPGTTAAQALIANGVPVPLSCEQGICGTCVMRVLEGVPEHRDLFLSDTDKAANDRFTPCCSRARSASLLIDF